MKSIAVALLAAGICGVAPAVTLVRSDFGVDAEGWNAFNGVDAREWVSSGGRPGGYIAATDGGADMIWAFQAPESWLGDRSAAIGGRLDWWLKTDTLLAPMAVPYADLKLGGGGVVLAIDAGADPGRTWTGYSVRFVPGAWRLGDYDGPLASAADIATVLTNLEFLHIRGEYSGLRDTGSLDSVVMTTVPELPTAPLVLAGLALLAMRRRPRD
jgi:MYXO-CTERM domain-containing protein